MACSVRVVNSKVGKVGFGQPGTLATRRCSTAFRCSTFDQALGAAPLVVARAAPFVVAGSFSGSRHGVDSLAASIGVRRSWWPPNRRRYFSWSVPAHNKSFKHAPSGLDALPRAA